MRCFVMHPPKRTKDRPRPGKLISRSWRTWRMTAYAKSTAAWKRLCIGAVRLGPWFGLPDVAVEEPRPLDLGGFRQSKCVFYVDAEVPDCALNLRVPEQDLNSAEVSGLLVDDARFGPPERVRPVILPTQSYAGDPLVHEPGVLPNADVSSVVG